MSSTVDRIKEKLSIVDVVGSYIKLEKAGANYKARCPFHNEKTPSFFISPTRSSYYCFGCGAKGDIFSFVEGFEGVDFMGALRILAERAGVPLERDDPEERTEKNRLFSVLERAALFYQSELGSNKEAEAYLQKRGLTEETVKEWRIGFAPDGWQHLFDHLSKEGITPSFMERAGLVKPSEKQRGKYYDRFRSRIMFPIFDSAGRIVGFSGRIFGKAAEDPKAAKYINSPETELFDKSRTLYGFHKAKNEIRRIGYTILVEGQMDLLMSHQSGFHNAVATSGTALTEGHVETLKRLSEKLMVAYDADKAGIAASERAWKLALQSGMEVKIARLPEGMDPADLILSDLSKWKEALTHSEHIVDFYLSIVLSSSNDSRKRGKEIELKVLPYVAVLESSIEQAHYIRTISEKAGIPEDALRKEIEKIRKNKGSETAPARNQAPQDKPETRRKSAIERKIFGVLYWLGTLPEKKVEADTLKEKVLSILGEPYYTERSAHFEKSRDELLFEADTTFNSSPAFAVELDELLSNLEEDCLKELFVESMKEVHLAEQLKDHERLTAVLKKCQDISERLRALGEKRIKQ